LFCTADAELTDLEYEHFLLVGYSRAVANMSIGTITLDPIKFNVSSGLWGLKGLRGLVSIDGVDVLGGTQEALLLGTNVTITNPSNLDLTMGDLGRLCLSSGSSAAETRLFDAVFQLFKGKSLLGTTLMPNLTLHIGNNSVAANTTFSVDAPLYHLHYS
jgi:hypothetical protein